MKVIYSLKKSIFKLLLLLTVLFLLQSQVSCKTSRTKSTDNNALVPTTFDPPTTITTTSTSTSTADTPPTTTTTTTTTTVAPTLATANLINSIPPIRGKATDFPVYIDIVGAGDIQQTVSSGAEANASTGAGIIFERYFGDKQTINSTRMDSLFQSLEMELVINLASTADTLIANFDEEGEFLNRRDFGNFLLYPVSKKQSMYFNSNIYFGYPKGFVGHITRWINGVNIRILTSNNTWNYDNRTIEMGALSFRAGIFHDFVPDDDRLDDEGRAIFSFFAGANFSYRAILGDITSSRNEEFRETVLGTRQTDFRGIELNAGFRLHNIRIEVQAPIFRSMNSVPGLTDTQFLFTIKFIGGFPIKIRSNKEDQSTVSSTSGNNSAIAPSP
jgi:hypothetical protein